MLILEKIGTALLLPVGLTIMALVTALALLHRPRLSATLIAFAVGWLWIWSTPWFAEQFSATLEHRYPARPAAEAPAADAIVILGAAAHAPAPPHRPRVDLTAASDRVLHGAELFRAGKAPVVIVSGGRPPQAPGHETEAETMRNLLVEWGVPEAAIVLEERARSTRQNAAYTAPIFESLGIRSILLVTSAQHMPRALRTFRAAGLEIVPAPTDVVSVPRRWTLLDLVPDSRALHTSSTAFREYLGLAHQALFGY